MIIHCDTTRYIWEVMEHSEYGIVFDDLVVLDVGCNIGTFSLWIKGRTSQIHAVDMKQEYLDLFAKTIKANGFDNIKLYKERLLDMQGFMDGHSIKHVDILKLDIEGDELEVVEHPKFPADRITTIVGEHHFYGKQHERFKKRLADLGYRYNEYANNHFVARR